MFYYFHLFNRWKRFHHITLLLVKNIHFCCTFNQVRLFKSTARLRSMWILNLRQTLSIDPLNSVEQCVPTCLSAHLIEPLFQKKMGRPAGKQGHSPKVQSWCEEQLKWKRLKKQSGSQAVIEQKMKKIRKTSSQAIFMRNMNYLFSYCLRNCCNWYIICNVLIVITHRWMQDVLFHVTLTTHRLSNQYVVHFHILVLIECLALHWSQSSKLFVCSQLYVFIYSRQSVN